MTTEVSMANKIVFTVLLLSALDANAALGDGDKIDFLPIPGEFCNADSDSKHRVRIPEQSCHLIQTKAATHSISKLPPIPVKSATPLKFKF